MQAHTSENKIGAGLDEQLPGQGAPADAGKGWRLFLGALLLSLVFLAALYALGGGPTYYESVDDAGMSMICAGLGVVDSPGDHLIYSHFLIGQGLSLLYSLNAAIPWYGLYLVSCQILALSAMTAVFLRKSRSMTAASVFFVILALGACSRPMLFMQFTSTACLLATAGCLLFLSTLEREKHPPSLSGWIAPLCLLGLATLIREEPVFMILLLTAILLPCRYSWKLHRRRLIAGALFVLVGLIVAMGCNYSKIAYYQKDEWKTFVPLCRLNRPIREYARFYDPGHQDAYRKAGWSIADQRVFQVMIYMLDPDRFGIDRLQKIWDHTPLVRTDDLRLDWVTGYLSRLSSDLSFAPAIVSLLLLLCAAPFSKLAWRGTAGYLLGMLAVCFALITQAKLPPYVYAGILSYSVAALLLFQSQIIPLRLARLRRRALLAGIGAGFICLLLLPVVGRYQDAARCQAHNGLLYRQAMRELSPAPGNLYVSWSSGFPVWAVRPFDDLRDYFSPDFKILRINSWGNCPIVKARLAQWHVKDLMNELDRADIYHFARADQFSALVAPYLVEHYGKQPLLEPVYHKPGLDFCVYRVRFTRGTSEPHSQP